MRKWSPFLVVAATFVLGCEDGPNQTFAPASGVLMNDGKGKAAVEPSRASFGDRYGSTNRQEICTADLKRSRWAQILKADIRPPRIYAGLDMAKSDLWEGLTIEDAEQPPNNPDDPAEGGGNCQATAYGCDSELCYSAWGDNGEVVFSYNIGTHIVYQMQFFLGYTGKVRFADRAGVYRYEMGVGTPHRRCSIADGSCEDFYLDWSNTAEAVAESDARMTAMYNAMMYTYAPELLGDTDETNCRLSRKCLVIREDGNGNAYFGVRPLAIYFVHRASGLPQPIPSSPTLIYNFFAKDQPYSNAPFLMKLDAEGPWAKQRVGAGASARDCTIKLGQKWSDYIASCVRVTGAQKRDDEYFNKLVGGRFHTDETWTFNIIGISQDFNHKQAWNEYITDAMLPSDDDVSTDFSVDVRAQGAVLNEVSQTDLAEPCNGVDDDNNGTVDDGCVTDLHGSGLVVREFMRLAQADATKLLGGNRPMGDPACHAVDPPQGCTGLEGLIIPGNYYPGDPLETPQVAALVDPLGVYDTSVITPGDPKSFICSDPGVFAHCDYGPFWDNIFQYVVKHVGRGDINQLPSEMRDRRYFYKHFTEAVVRYLKAVGKHGVSVTPSQVAAIAIDRESLVWDHLRGEEFDNVVYVDREFQSDANPVPIHLEYGTDVRSGNQRSTSWYKRWDREEYAMYDALATVKGEPTGIENNVLPTNLFGSQVLTEAWASYGCAIGTTPQVDCENEGSAPPPPEKNLHGGPRLELYPGAWGRTAFSMGDSPIRITRERPEVMMIEHVVPNFKKPYEATMNPAADELDDTRPEIEAATAWFPDRPGVGFHMMFSGTRDQFFQAPALDYNGLTTTMNVFYKRQLDPLTQLPKEDGTIRIVAVEAYDFLGEVFLCRDPNTGDLLGARMYDSVFHILDWLNSHPGTFEACDIIVQYTPANNYVDQIGSRKYGVRLGVIQNQGLGRVIDATLYDPSLAASN